MHAHAHMLSLALPVCRRLKQSFINNSLNDFLSASRTWRTTCMRCTTSTSSHPYRGTDWRIWRREPSLRTLSNRFRNCSISTRISSALRTTYLSFVIKIPMPSHMKVSDQGARGYLWRSAVAILRLIVWITNSCGFRFNAFFIISLLIRWFFLKNEFLKLWLNESLHCLFHFSLEVILFLSTAF